GMGGGMGGPPSGGMGGGMGGPPGGGMGGAPGGGPGQGASGSHDSSGIVLGLLTGSDRITLDLAGDRLIVAWMDGLPQFLPLGKRSHRIELPTGEHMRIRAWEDPYEDGAIVVRRKVGSVVLMEAFLPPKSPDELIVVVTAKAPSLAMPLAFRRVYRRQVEEDLPPGGP
ncbi:MAG: hypothetical protein JXB39_15535, partial [Deltaproteobacteria bacterium]|nr:hypothetical protein [Deltaproteobacteria bacterium]